MITAQLPTNTSTVVSDMFFSDNALTDNSFVETSPAIKSGVTVMNFAEDCSTDSQNSRFILNSLLSFASNADDQRWATFITCDPSEYLRLHQLKLNSKKFRIIYLKNKNDLLWVTWDALAAGNSHTVIIQSHLAEQSMSDDVYENLNKASRMGNTAGILLNNIATSNMTTSKTIDPASIDA